MLSEVCSATGVEGSALFPLTGFRSSSKPLASPYHFGGFSRHLGLLPLLAADAFYALGILVGCLELSVFAPSFSFSHLFYLF